MSITGGGDGRRLERFAEIERAQGSGQTPRADAKGESLVGGTATNSGAATQGRTGLGGRFAI